MTLAAGPHAMRALAVVAFLESSIFPIPPDAMLVPMVLAQPATGLALWRLIATVASVVGGLAGYAIGYSCTRPWASGSSTLYGLGDEVRRVPAACNEWGLWIILIKGLTPIPYKLVTIASGLANFNLGIFILASHRHPRGALLPAGGPAARSSARRSVTSSSSG